MIRGVSLAIATAMMTTSVGCMVREAPLNAGSTFGRLYDSTMDSEMFRAALEHARLRDGQVRVDPRLLLGWRDYQPHMSESPRELFQRRREILVELGIPEQTRSITTGVRSTHGRRTTRPVRRRGRSMGMPSVFYKASGLVSPVEAVPTSAALSKS
jgi:hypothetical protein